jgi:hypothetical protein
VKREKVEEYETLQFLSKRMENVDLILEIPIQPNRCQGIFGRKLGELQILVIQLDIAAVCTLPDKQIYRFHLSTFW